MGFFIGPLALPLYNRCVVFGRALAFGVQKVSILVFFRVAVWSFIFNTKIACHHPLARLIETADGLV